MFIAAPFSSSVSIFLKQFDLENNLFLLKLEGAVSCWVVEERFEWKWKSYFVFVVESCVPFLYVVSRITIRLDAAFSTVPVSLNGCSLVCQLEATSFPPS